MNTCLTYGIPLVLVIGLVAVAAILWWWQAHATEDRGKPTAEHSERLYRDYEFYLKVMLALVVGFGYVRLQVVPQSPDLGRQALVFLGAINLHVMATFSFFVIAHMGSKLRRWKKIEWPKAIFWQEIWACLSMWVFSVGFWIAAIKW